jgi:bifunctional non-homologous end joining protein LigD
VQKQGAAIHGINKKVLLVGLPSPIVVQTQKFSRDVIIDGEMVGDVHYAFDPPQLGDDSLANRPFKERLALLAELLDAPFNHLHQAAGNVPTIRPVFFLADCE